jgi:hypothetical protein
LGTRFQKIKTSLASSPRQYLRDFNRLDESSTTIRELYDAMLELYPDRANPGSLWGGAKIGKKSA